MSRGLSINKKKGFIYLFFFLLSIFLIVSCQDKNKGKEFSITFETNGGTPVQTIKGIYKDSVTAPVDPTKEGYTFKGWYTTEDFSNLPYKFKTIEPENIVLYAKWEINEYTISFETNGGSLLNSLKKKYQETLSAPIAPTKEGFSFQGWFSDEELTIPFDFDIMPDHDITIYAKWSVKSFQITFNSNGGNQIDSVFYDFGDVILDFESPAKVGHTFIGWYEDSELKKIFDLEKMPNKDITLYAKWEVNSYTYSFQTNGSSEIEDILVLYNSEFSLPTPTKISGKVFAGWYLDSELTIPYDYKRTPASDITVYAKWESEGYKVSFITDSPQVISSIYFNYNEDVRFNIIPTKTGYDFVGWFFEDDTEFTSLVMPAHDIVLYAKWTESEFKITFNSTGGSQVDDIVEYYNFDIFKPSNPTKPGYTFVNWYTDINCTNLFTFHKMPAYNLTLYAKWENASYTITFNSMGGSVVLPITLAYESVIALPSGPTLEGYTFDGWYQEEELENKFLLTTMPIGDFTLYAKWKLNEYTIVFETDGGSNVNSLTAPYKSTITKPQNPTKTGHTFDGWYLDSNLTSQYEFTTMPLGGLTLYAKWTKLSYKIEFETFSEDSILPIFVVYSSIINLPKPTKTGYTFDGWYLDSNFNILFSINTMPAYDLKLYAKWEIAQFVITIETNGGDFEISELSLDYNEVINQFNEPTLKGHTFDGWYLDEDFNIEFSLNNMPAYDFTIYAKYEINSYEISFDTSFEQVINPISFDYNTNIILPQPLDRTGYTFDNWYTSSDYEQVFDLDKMPDYNFTIYAKYDINSYTISFVNDRELTINDITFIYMQEITLPDIILVTGYTFDNWYTSSDYAEVFNLDKMPAYDFTLYAKYDVNSYKIIFNTLGGNLISSRLVVFNQPLNITETPVKTGHTFVNWYKEETCENLFSLDKMPANDVNIYAKYSKNTYTVTLDLNGGVSDTTTFNIVYDGFYTFTSTITKKEYVFKGLYTEDLVLYFDENLVQTRAWDIAKDTTLYARFIVKTEYTVTYINAITFESDTKPTINGKPQNMTITLDGYLFNGWYQSFNDGYTLHRIYDLNNVIFEDITIYADFVELGLQPSLGNLKVEVYDSAIKITPIPYVTNYKIEVYLANTFLVDTIEDTNSLVSLEGLNPGEYKLVITGYNDLTSEKTYETIRYIKYKILEKPSNIKVNYNDSLITFNPVIGAISYDLYYKLSSDNNFIFYKTSENNYFDIPYMLDVLQYDIKIIAKNEYGHEQENTITFNNKLTMSVNNITTNNLDTIYFDHISNHDYYQITINNIIYTTTDNYFVLPNIDETEEFIITFKVYSNNLEFLNSRETTFVVNRVIYFDKTTSEEFVRVYVDNDLLTDLAFIEKDGFMMYLYLDIDFNDQFYLVDPITKPLTLFIKYVPGEYKVYLEHNNSMPVIVLNAQYTYQLPILSYLPTKTGHRFLGYFDSSDVKYYDNALKGVLPFNVSEDLYLFAKYEPITYIITLETDETLENYQVFVDYETYYHLEVPTKDYSVFKGWFTLPNGQGTKMTDENGQSLNMYYQASNITLYPYFVNEAFNFVLINGEYQIEAVDSITLPSVLEIPEYYQNIKITSIKERGFQNKSITKVILSNNIKYIGDEAFKDCILLEEISIPSSVNYIGKDVLKGTKLLQNDETVIIDGWLFKLDSQLTSYQTSNIKGICSNAIENHSNLVNIEFTDDVLYYQENILKNTSITHLSVNLSKISSIAYLFGFSGPSFNSNLTSLESIRINNTNTINEEALQNIVNLEEIVLDNNLQTIKKHAFKNLGKLETITIPNSVTTIELGILEGANSLLSITLPFVGTKRLSSSNTHFGYIFGATSFSLNNNFVPSSLKVVDITNTTLIPSNSFNGCLNIKSIILVDTINSIGVSAFKNAKALESINIPSSLNILENELFMYCSSLSSIIIPDNIRVIGESVFRNNTNLETIVIPNQIEEIGAYTFSGCIKLTSIELKNINTISEGLFLDAVNLVFVTIPNTVTKIERESFKNNSSLETIILPNSITQIDQEAFKDCSSLTNVTLPSNLTEISEGLFANCIMLNNIILPQNIIHISASSFINNQSLEYIEIPSGVVVISPSTFKDCIGLERVTFSPNIKTISEEAFRNCTSLLEVNLPDNLEVIKDSAFTNCSSLTDIIIPNTVYIVGYQALKDTFITSLETPFVGNIKNDTTFVNLGYIFGSNNYLDDYLYVPNTLINLKITNTTYIFTNSVYGISTINEIYVSEVTEFIYKGAFVNLSGLNKLTLPFVGFSNTNTSNTHFGYIFNASSHILNNQFVPQSLKEVNITHSSQIYHDAFNDCQNIEYLNINDEVEFIQDNAFSNMISLLEFRVPQNVNKLSQYVFDNCIMLKEIDLSNVIQIDKYAFNDCITLDNLVLPESLLYIEEHAFNGCTNLTNITFNTNLESIKQYAFSDCVNLDNILLPDSLTTLGKYAFNNCTSLETIILSNSLNIIEEGLFNNATSLDNVILPDGILTISNNAFNNCSSLENIVLNNQLLTIKENAFSNMNSLTSIVIPNSVESIEEGIFRNTSNLRVLTIPFIANDILNSKYHEVYKLFGLESNLDVSANLEEIHVTNQINIGDDTFKDLQNILTITLNDQVQTIGNNAFKNTFSLNNIVMPQDLEEIGSYAFYNSNTISSFVFKENLEIINEYAFSNMQNLQSVDLSQTKIEVLENNLFENSSNLTLVILPNTLKSISSFVFNSTNLTGINLHEGLEEIGESAFKDNSNITTLTIPKSVEAISENAFKGLSSLSFISIPFVGDNINNITKNHLSHIFDEVPTSLVSVEVTVQTVIKESAFKDLVNIETIRIKEATILEEESFMNMDSLSNVYLDKVVEIKERAFKNASNLFGITLPSTLIVIASEAFINSSLNSITINEGVLEIGSKAFKNNQNLTSVIFPQSLIKINEEAFMDNPNLNNLNLSYVLEIEPSAFKNNTSLSIITLSNDLEIISESVFENNTSLVSITLPTLLKEIHEKAFKNTAITSLVIPYDTDLIGKGALEDCLDLSELTVPFIGESLTTNTFLAYIFGGNSYLDYNKVPTLLTTLTIDGPCTTIDERALYNLEQLLYVNISQNTRYIKEEAFYNLNQIVSLDLSYVEGIYSYAFYNMTSLQSVTFGNNLTLLEAYAFSNNTSLNNLTLPDSLEEIGAYAFSNNTTLEKVLIPDGVITIGEGAFKDCINVNTITFGAVLQNINSYAFYNNKQVTELTFTSSIRNIGAYSFGGLDLVLDLNVLNDVLTIDQGAFYNMDSLENVTLPFIGRSFADTNSFIYVFSSIIPSIRSVVITSGNIVYENSFTNWVNIQSITLPSTIQEIRDSAFSGCSSLLTFTIPSLVTSINKNVFKNNTSLHTIIFESDLTLIDDYAFSGCTSLEHFNKYSTYSLETEEFITLTSLTKIGKYAFENVRLLSNITLNNSVQEIGEGAFKGLTSLNTITLPFTGHKEIEETNSHFGYIFGALNYTLNNSTPSSLTKITISKQTVIHPYAFYNLKNVTNIILDTNVTEIKDFAFANTEKVEQYQIPQSVEKFGASIFKGCTKLSTLIISFIGDDKTNPTITNLGYLFNNTAPTNNKSDVVSSLRSVELTNTDFVGAYAFYNLDILTTITLPNTITKIGQYAFSGCKNITSLNLTDNITEINAYAFNQMTSLQSIHISSGLSIINEGVFKDLTAITSITIPSTINIISDSAFFGVNNIENIVIPSSVTEIQKQAFKNMTNLKTVTVDGNISVIDEKAFENNINLESVTFYYAVSEIKDYAFNGCKKLSTFNFNEGLVSLGKYAFLDCIVLNNVVLPNSLEIIEEGAFKNNYGLTNITLGNSLREIHKDAFYQTNNLLAILLPITLEVIGPRAFYNNISLTTITIPSGVTIIEEEVFRNNTSLQTVVLLGNVTMIKKQAFDKCINLVSINLPSTIAYIGEAAFRDCSKLTQIDLSLNTSLLTIDKMAFYNAYAITTLILPSNIENILDYAFYNLKAVTSLILPTSLQEIGIGAFKNMQSLQSIDIPSNIEEIKNEVFENNRALQTVNLNATLTSIGERAFKGCESLINISFNPNISNISMEAFENCSSLQTVDLSLLTSLLVINERTFKNCVSLYEVLLPNSIVEIKEEAFYNTALQTLTLPNSLTELGIRALSSIETISSITIPSSITVIEKEMFKGNTNLQTLNANLTEIQESAFENCTNLQTIDLSNVVTIGKKAFENCTSLNNITLNSSLSVIEENVFKNNTSLSVINIHDDITEIKKFAFYNTAITSFIAPSNLEVISESVFENALLSSITLHSNILGIEKNAFKGNVAITNLEIPSSVQYLGFGALEGLNSLSSLILPFVGEENNGLNNTHLGYLFGNSDYTNNQNNVPTTLTSINVTTTTIIGKYAFANLVNLSVVDINSLISEIDEYAFYNTAISTINITDNITNIGKYAFSKCYNLTSIVLPYTLQTISEGLLEDSLNVETLVLPVENNTIGKYAFKGLEKITSVIISNELTLIDEEAFMNMSLLQSVNLESVLYIKDRAFKNTISLETVVFSNMLEEIGREAFFNSFIENINITSNNIEIEEYAFSEISNLQRVTLPYGLVVLNKGLFKNNPNLIEVNISSVITTINEEVFMNNSLLNQIDLYSSLTTLKENAFTNCTSLVNITLPDSLTIIESQVFKGCTNLALVTFGNSVTEIKKEAFMNCSSLDNVVLPNTLLNIRESAFMQTKITEIVIPQSVEHIEKQAFFRCDRLTKVTVFAELISIGEHAFSQCSSLTSFVGLSTSTNVYLNAFEGSTSVVFP